MMFTNDTKAVTASVSEAVPGEQVGSLRSLLATTGFVSCQAEWRHTPWINSP